MIDRLARTLAERFPALAMPRTADSHKGSYGTALLIGGSRGMTGALILAASACQLLGAGKTYACAPDSQLEMLPGFPEILTASLDSLPASTAAAIGCGLGGSRAALETMLIHAQNQPLILDADALNLLAANPDYAAALKHRSAPTLLTPHPLEAARLLGTATADIQSNRSAAAQAIAGKYHAITILKGSQSLITDGKRTILNDSGNAGLASAGTGDVLTGILASLLAQHFPPFDAAAAAAYLHGAAADYLGNGLPLAGLLASEIAPAARLIRHTAVCLNASQNAAAANTEPHKR